MQLKDILSFKKESFFNGAVQADWFYDEEKSKIVSESYVFHGTKYFGVHESDVDTSNHSLIDTVSFAKTIMNKLYEDKDSSRFMLTIAGYGAGKSHLAVTLGNLISRHNTALSSRIIDNMISADDTHGEIFERHQQKKNLVIVLNGMNNFNLDFEIIKSCKLALKQHHLNEDIIENMTESYNVASHFLNQNFDLLGTKFDEYAQSSKYQSYSGNILKEKLMVNIQSDIEAFNIVNEVYKAINGSYIRWDDGITGARVLAKLCDELCHKQEIFENIVILFDEFGRYIEYTASNPKVAGDAALQQIFECVQNANGKMLFAGFIQSDLNAYMQRISENTNVIRYVGRYEASDKYYLSSNFETVLANLITKTDKYQSIISQTLTANYGGELKRLYGSITRWIGTSTKKAVWTKETIFNQLIIKGCFPIHPLTIWLLTNLSAWMQQRSTLTFVETLIQEKSNMEVDTSTLLDMYAYPIQIIDSPIFYELYNAEEKGLQNSQHCLLYKEILTKYEDRLSSFDINVLKSLVIINIAKFNIYDKEDMIVAIRYCSNMLEENIRGTLKNLEESFGIIEFDQNTNRYYFIAEARGKNEFNRVLRNKSFLVKHTDMSELLNDEIIEILGVNKDIDTAFGQQNKIASLEWVFSREFISIIDFTDSYVRAVVSELQGIPDMSTPRGKMVILYTTSETQDCLNTVRTLYDRHELYKYPIIIMELLDVEGKMFSILKERVALLSFTNLEREMYAKFYAAHLAELNKQLTRNFTELTGEKLIVRQEGIERVTTNARMLALEEFNRLYYKAVPFMLDGFNKKSTTSNAMKSFETMCSGLLDKTITNKQSVDTLTVEIRNKIKALLLEDGMYSWGVLNSSYNLIEPRNEIIKEIFEQIKKDIPESGTIQGNKLFTKYMEAPYSLNIYSLTMLVCYVLGSNHEQGILMVYNNGVPVSIEVVKTTLFSKKNGLTQILNYSYGFMEKDAVERMQSLIVQIKANKYVEKCQELLERLNKLATEQVMPSELSEEAEYCRGLLNNGLVLKQQIYRTLDMHKTSVAKIITFADTAKDYEAAISIIEKFPKHENIQGNISFLYSPEFLQEYKKLRIEVMSVLKNNIEQYINALSPNGDIRRVDYIKSRIAIISNKLNKLGLLETQEAATQIGKKIIQDIEAKHKYQSIIDDIEYDIRKWKQELTEGWQVLHNNLYLMQEKKLYIEENVQDNNVTIEYSKELDNIIQQYKTKIQGIEGDIEANIAYITEATSLEEVESILSTITRRGNAFVPDAYKNKVEAIKQCFNEAREQIKNTVAECTITSLKDDINSLQLKISEFPTQVVIYELESVLQEKLDRQNRWMTENVHALVGIDTFDVKRCIDYINRLQNYPRYITSDQEVKIEEKIALLNNRIKQCRVEGVVNLFLQLSDAEKQQCIKQLNEMI